MMHVPYIVYDNGSSLNSVDAIDKAKQGGITTTIEIMIGNQKSLVFFH